MKQIRLVPMLLLGGLLLACRAQAPTVVPPPLASADAYLLRGDQSAANEAYAQAILDYTAAIRLQPDSAEAYNNRGYAYYWHYETANAIADYTQAIALRPTYAYAYNNRCAAYMASSQPARAIEDCNQALALQPDFPQAYINRGNAYLRTGAVALAFADFRQGGLAPLRSLLIIGGIGLLLITLAVVGYRRRLALLQPS